MKHLLGALAILLFASCNSSVSSPGGHQGVIAGNPVRPFSFRCRDFTGSGLMSSSLELSPYLSEERSGNPLAIETLEPNDDQSDCTYIIYDPNLPNPHLILSTQIPDGADPLIEIPLPVRVGPSHQNQTTHFYVGYMNLSDAPAALREAFDQVVSSLSFVQSILEASDGSELGPDVRPLHLP